MKRAETEGKNLAELAATIKRVFPKAAAEYAQLGRTIDEFINEVLAQHVRKDVA